MFRDHRPLQVPHHQWFWGAVKLDRLFVGGKALAPYLSLEGIRELTERAWLNRAFLNSFITCLCLLEYIPSFMMLLIMFD